MKYNNDIIEKLKTDLERKYNLGNRNTWTHSDFEKMKELLESKSKHPISISTIKRLYGKIKGDVEPRQSSLDCISVFLGYKSWYDYQQQHKKKPIQSSPKPIKKKNPNKTLKYSIFLSSFLLLVFLAFLYRNMIFNPAKSNLKRDFIFSTTDTLGFSPHNVMLKIDLHKLKGNNFRIHNPEKGFIPISKNTQTQEIFLRNVGIEHITLYQNETQLKSIPLLIQSHEWIAYPDYKNTNVDAFKNYHFYSSIKNDSSLLLPTAIIINNIQNRELNNTFYLYSRIVNHPLTNFKIETRFRVFNNISIDDRCMRIYLTINATHDFISIPFGHESCLKDLYIFTSKNKQSTINDHPEEFGISSEWQDLIILKKGSHISLFRNGYEIYSDTTSLDWGNLNIIKYKFIRGNGEIDYFRLYDENGSALLIEEFNE